MPELPEVETLKRKLAKILIDKKISQVKILSDKSFHGDSQQILDVPMTNVWRRAKIIGFDFANQLTLVTHLKMTGQLIYVDEKIRLGGGHPSSDWIRNLPSSHTRIEYLFEDGGHLFFNDQRKFGWMKLINFNEIDQLFEHVAPDIIDDRIDTNYLKERLSRTTRPIKLAIMDNSILAGVGNIYACDSLNLAKISPTRPAKSLNFTEIERLTQAMKTIVFQAIKLGGTTFDGKYVQVDGLAGGYQDKLRVYGLEGNKCPNCQHPIEKIRLGGRGTYYCPNCQK